MQDAPFRYIRNRKRKGRGLQDLQIFCISTVNVVSIHIYANASHINMQPAVRMRADGNSYL